MMGPNLIGFTQASGPQTDLSGLKAYLAQLVGEPFQFIRISYGDEPTLHFGDLRPSRSPKLKNKLYGAYVLGLRASAWILKSLSRAELITAGVLHDPLPPGFGQPVTRQELEDGGIMAPLSRVQSATPFVVEPAGGFGLQLVMSDGSSLLVLPRSPQSEESDEADLPELADWDLLGPHGLLRAGPHLEWSFEPAT
jgi:hypothetical protein